MGSNTSTPVSQTDSTVPTVVNNKSAGEGEEAAVQRLPPPGCPLHNKVNDLKPTEPGQCPVTGKGADEQKAPARKFTISDCPIHAGKANESKENDNMNELNPANMVTSQLKIFRFQSIQL